MAASDGTDSVGGRPVRLLRRFSLKQLLGVTLVACLVCAIAFGPRRYTATASATFSSLPGFPARHPRFVQYHDARLSDEEVVRRELPRILDDKIVAEATKRLAEAGVRETELGGDASKWLREHVEIESHSSHITVRVSAWQAWYAGRENFRRNTLAWKALLALLSAYQADALGELTESVSVPLNGPGTRPPLPRLIFSSVDSGWW